MSETLTRLERVATKVATLLAERDALIVAALEEGHSTRAVGAAAGMSHVGAAKVRARH